MFREIATFELRYHLKSPLFALFFLGMSVLTFLIAAGDPADGFGAVNSVKANSPYVIMQCLMMMSLFGALTTTAFVVNSIHRDFELNTDALFFSRPITKLQYMGGRFAGSFAVSLLVFVGVCGAIVAGAFAPWLKDAVGPVRVWPYVWSMAVLVLPNLLFIGSIVFAVAALTRSLMASYASLAAISVLYGVAQTLAEDTENDALAGVLDPFGVRASFVVMRYWTVFQKNTQVMPLEGVFLWNRVLWLAVSALVLGVAYARFRSAARPPLSKPAALPPANVQAAAEPRLIKAVAEPPHSERQFAAIVGFEIKATLKSLPFLIILFCGICIVVGNTVDSEWLGKPYPLTREMIESIRFGFQVFALLIAAFYAGDIVWRERSLRVQEVTDAMPVPTWVQWGAKLASLVVVVMATLAAAVATTIVMQTLRGWHHYEFALYAKGIFGIVGVRMALIAGLAFLFQIFFNHKLAALIGVSVYYVLNLMLPRWGFESLLYRYASAPPYAYSDMNGYGHFAAPLFWTSLYWLLFVALMLAAGHLFWIRGSETRLRQRLQIARQRFSKPIAVTMAALFAGFAATGCYIYVNTEQTTKEELQALAANAEKQYKRYEQLPQPRIVAVKANVAIHPDRRAVFIDGSYLTVNKTNVPIADVHVNWPVRSLTSIDLTIPGATLASDDGTHGYRIYRLAEPLQPGASLTIRFKTARETKGFGLGNTRIVENGTFITNFDYFPHIGYHGRGELQTDREKHGLPPLQRMKKADDPRALQENGRGTDWISLDTVVSTSADQIALAPGYLQRQWSSNGRRFFHYKTTSPILGFFSYLSARYEVKRDHWNGIPIEIYYDKKHPYNVDRMIFGVKKSLDYFTTNFSPYQHKQVRILEFPGYANFAQSFPNTIPFSETLGFVSDQRDPDALDYVFYVTAHEVAHQWWGHQIVPAYVQGAQVLTETLAQYSALMVLKRELGDVRMKGYLKWELDRYFAGRGREAQRELPLVRVERQDYIQYNKGALAMYRLQDTIGEERVNRALRKYLAARAFTGPPYNTAPELVQYLRAEAPPEHQELITDLFERITLYDLQAREVVATRRADGKYVVKMTVSATKLRSAGTGEEQAVPIDDWIDVGVTGEDGRPLLLQKRRITRPVETFEVVVNAKPARAGIDPLNKLIDSRPRDNTKPL